MNINNEFNINEVFNLIRSSDYHADKVLSIIESSNESEKKELLTAFSNALIEANEPKTRNRIAIAMQDLGDRKALVPLIDAIRNPNTKGARGTLIYAMSEFNPIEYIFDLVKLVIEDSYESSGNALDIVEELEGTMDIEEYDKSIKYIKEQIPKLSEDKKEDALYLIELLE
jgi:hypothetical protein